MRDPLRVQAEDFASRLTDLFRGCLADAPEFAVAKARRAGQMRVGPMPFGSGGSGFGHIPLLRSCDSGKVRLTLKIEFTVSLDDEADFLTVQESTQGLWVRTDPDKKSRPLVRVEYDRYTYNKPPAHVHLHAESPEFGWVYGTAGLPMPRLSDFHFPLGGRRFRPTVEDFLRFLNREKLFVDWRSGWERRLEVSLRDWEQNQAAATVRRYPEAAVHQLGRMGYEINPPPASVPAAP